MRRCKKGLYMCEEKGDHAEKLGVDDDYLQISCTQIRKITLESEKRDWQRY